MSLDYGFCKRKEQDAKLLLVIYDRHTKSFYAVPTQSKAGQSMSYLVTELVRFVRHLEIKARKPELPLRTTRPMVRWSKRGSKLVRRRSRSGR